MKTINYLKLLFVALLFSQALNAQTFNAVFGETTFRDIPKGTVYLVLTGNKTFDDKFQKTIDEYWKATPLKTIQARDIDKYMNNENNYFLTSMYIQYNPTMKLTIRPVQPSDLMIYIVFFNGKLKNLDKYVDYYMMEMYTYKMFFDEKVSVDGLEYAVKFINDNIAQDITDGNNTGTDKVFTPEVLKTKTLLISQFQFNHFMRQAMLDKYKYNYKILSSEDLAKKIKANDKDCCYLDCSWGSGRIFDLETRAMIYGFTTNALFKAKQQDFEDLNSCIEGDCKVSQSIHMRYIL